MPRICKRWAWSKSHSPELSSPIFLKTSTLRMGWTCPSMTRLSTFKPFCGVGSNSKSVMSLRSIRCVVGATDKIGCVTLLQTIALDRITQVRPLGCNLRFSSGVSGITMLASSAIQTSPGDTRRVDGGWPTSPAE